MQVITFSKAAKNFILDAFGKEENREKLMIVEKDTKEPVFTDHGETVAFEEFAGIRKGSEIYIKSDIASLIEFYESTRLWDSGKP